MVGSAQEGEISAIQGLRARVAYTISIFSISKNWFGSSVHLHEIVEIQYAIEDTDFHAKNNVHSLIKCLESPLLTACRIPYSPQALLIVCLYHITGSSSPLPS